MAKAKRKNTDDGSGGDPSPTVPRKPLNVVLTRQFKKDFEKAKRSGKDGAKLNAIMRAIAERRPLEAAREDHPLRGGWKGYHECHVEGDWLLIYKITESEAIFTRTGTHSELFGR